MTARHPIRWTTVTIDCALGDAERVGRFYAELLAWEITARDGAGWLQLRDPAGGIGLNVQGEAGYRPPVWPERAGEQQKMLHFEVLVDDLAEAVRLALRAGGSEASPQPPDRDQTRLRVMLDPAGHPFCLFVDGE